MSRKCGSFVGWKPQYRVSVTSEWKLVPWEQVGTPHGVAVRGIPFPTIDGGILQEAWLLGRAQAQAIAWIFAANYEATHSSAIDVRIIPFDVNYTIEYEPKET